MHDPRIALQRVIDAARDAVHADLPPVRASLEDVATVQSIADALLLKPDLLPDLLRDA